MTQSRKPYHYLTVQPLNPVIGARIGGVRLSGDLSAEVVNEIKRALHEHLVIFFADQDITPEEHRGFGRLFADLQIHDFLPSLDGYPEIVVLENDEARPPQVNFWHADVTFRQTPPIGAILLAREIPACGGDTMWANMYAAYDALSDSMRRFVSGLSAIHVGRVAEYENAYGRKNENTALPQAEHPVVRIHPETQRAGLYVNPVSTTEIVGMNKAESDAILQMLFMHMQTPEFQIRFSWEKNAVAFWDNRCTQHYALADYWPMRRVMHRVILDGNTLK